MSHAVVRFPDPTGHTRILHALHAVPLLNELHDNVMDRLAAISKIVTVPADTVVCRQAEAADILYIVLEGQLAVSSSAGNGTAAVVEVVRPGGMVGLATLLARMPRLVSARAINPCTLLSIDAQALLGLMAREMSLITAMLRAEAEDVRALVRQVCDLKLRTTAQRLACYLLALVIEPAGNTAALRLPFDKRLLAARLGCRQENLSRAFAALRDFGVETHGARVILHDISRLRSYALPDEPFDPV